jgi:membrane protein DedA with SNARE-associated domain
VTAWIEGLIESWGAAGVAVLMFLENVFPPIPSELVLPLAGYKAAEGHLSLPLALAAGTIGSLAGVTLWYLAARAVGTAGLKHFARKHGRLLTLTPGDIDKVNEWFGRHGGKAILIGRLVPGVRTLISIPAGVCGMSLTRFLLLSAVGTAAWSTVLILAGHTLGKEFDRVESWVSPVGNVVLGGAMLYYLYRVITFRRHVDPPSDG